jgi:hypothetical protein
LVILPAGGAAPFVVEWFAVPNGTPNSQGAGGVFVGNPATEMNYQPVLPIWHTGSHYTYWAQITDARGVVIRTNQSGPHTPGIFSEGSGRNVWVGPGTNDVNAWNVPQPNSGGTANVANHNHQVTLEPGLYRLEAWGASGGRGIWSSSILGNSGWGGYTQTFLRVDGTGDQTIFILPGGSGQGAHQAYEASIPGVRTLGGLNGGGQGGSPVVTHSAGQGGGGGGGGATHISFAAGLLTNTNVRDRILIVAGGGGGGGHSTNVPWSTWWAGFPGGGWDAPTHGTHVWGGSQTAGGAKGVFSSTPAQFLIESSTAGGPGFGGNSKAWHQDHNWNLYVYSGGGGGGWFGGGGGGEVSNRGIGGGGGSSYIAPFLRHAANGVALGSPAAGTSFWWNTTRGAAGSMHFPGGIANSHTQVPQHPSGEQREVTVLPGAVRIIRLQ